MANTESTSRFYKEDRHMTMSRMAMKTAWMMEEMRRNAIDETFETYKKLI